MLRLTIIYQFKRYKRKSKCKYQYTVKLFNHSKNEMNNKLPVRSVDETQVVNTQFFRCNKAILAVHLFHDNFQILVNDVLGEIINQRNLSVKFQDALCN